MWDLQPPRHISTLPKAEAKSEYWLLPRWAILRLIVSVSPCTCFKLPDWERARGSKRRFACESASGIFYCRPAPLVQRYAFESAKRWRRA